MMSLTKEQIRNIQTSFAQIGDADALASRFYARLFQLDPSVQALFSGDMAQQRMKLVQTLAVVVNGLNNPAVIIPAIENLGQRHVVYGVTVAHWQIVGTALLWALTEHFGDALTRDVFDAWAAAYDFIARTAIAAAYPQETAL